MNTPLLFGRHMHLDLKEGVSLVQVDSRLQEVHPWQHEDGDLSLSDITYRWLFELLLNSFH